MPHRHEGTARLVAGLCWVVGAASLVAILAVHWGTLEGEGLNGIAALPAAVLVGALLLTRRATSSDGAALGLVMPTLLFALAEVPIAAHQPGPVDLVATLALALGSLLAAYALACSLGREGDAARTRVAISSFFVAVLAPLLAFTVLSAPRGRSMFHHLPPHPPSAWLVVAALVSLVALVELERRKTRALAWLALLALLLDASPSWGSYACGCMPCPGPIEWPGYLAAALVERWLPLRIGWLPLLFMPPVLTAAALAPWALPVWRYLRD